MPKETAMHRRRRQEQGFTLIPAIALLSILMLLATAYVQGVFTFHAKKTKHEERAMTAAAVAEAGMNQTLARLSATGGQLVGTPMNNTNRFAAMQAITETNGTDVVGSYDVTYEDGTLIGSATTTGSTTAGKDKWGNDIWWPSEGSAYKASTRMQRFGIKVDGYATYADGSRKPGGQSVYVRAVMNQPQVGTTTVAPADYVLYSNGDMTINNKTVLDGGLTHTNGNLVFRWQTYSPTSWQHLFTEITQVYSPITYVSSLSYVYYHTHAGGSTSHTHTASLNTATRPWGKDMVYSATQPTPPWTNAHQHDITNAAVQASILADSNFFTWGSASYQPQVATTKTFPSMSLAEMLKLTDPNAGTTDYSKGYIVGNVDFRGTYFGQNLRYTGESGNPNEAVAFNKSDPAGTPTYIFVNYNTASSDYMKVKKWVAGPLPTDYALYEYREIPANGMILVRDGEVKIGNYWPIAPATGTGAEGATTVPLLGPSTIIDGKLTIASYTDNAASSTGTGDITVCGSVMYRNKVYIIDGMGARQYAPGESTPTSLSDARTWITNVDGTPTTTTLTNGDQVPVGRPCSLALYASNNVNIPLRPYLNASETSSGPNDILRIMGQIMAGANSSISSATKAANPNDYRLRQVIPATSTITSSDWDLLRVYGSVSSYNAPKTSYFNRREYRYDRTLQAMPPLGQPYISPAATYLYIPQIIPGSWMQMAAS
jgi:type II secretory pathway pseudopilin PulG